MTLRFEKKLRVGYANIAAGEDARAPQTRLRSALCPGATANLLFLLFPFALAPFALVTILAAAALLAFARIVFAFANFLRHTRQRAALREAAQLGCSPDEAR